jgi:hypothetical protein
LSLSFAFKDYYDDAWKFIVIYLWAFSIFIITVDHFLCKITLFTWIISSAYVVKLFQPFALMLITIDGLFAFKMSKLSEVITQKQVKLMAAI